MSMVRCMYCNTYLASSINECRQLIDADGIKELYVCPKCFKLESLAVEFRIKEIIEKGEKEDVEKKESEEG